MTLIELDIPNQSERMATRNGSDLNSDYDLNKEISIEPIQERACFALRKISAKTSEERRKIRMKNIEQKRQRNKLITTDNITSIKNEKEIPKELMSLAEIQLAGNLRKLRYDRSLIHQWGVYTTEPIKKNEAVIEYIGEIIRLRVADKRQIRYEGEGNNGSYIFQLEKDKYIDATHKGGLARFINHSCSPNCYTQCIQFANSNHIVIYAKRDIEAYEELCYDYKMEYEKKEKRIRCLCGSPNCKQWLNWSEQAELELTYNYDGREPKYHFQSAPDGCELGLSESSENLKSSESIDINESTENNEELVTENEILYDASPMSSEFDSQNDPSDSDEFSDSEDFYEDKSYKSKKSRKQSKLSKSKATKKQNKMNTDKNMQNRSTLNVILNPMPPVNVNQAQPSNSQPFVTVKQEPLSILQQISLLKIIQEQNSSMNRAQVNNQNQFTNKNERKVPPFDINQAIKAFNHPSMDYFKGFLQNRAKMMPQNCQFMQNKMNQANTFSLNPENKEKQFTESQQSKNPEEINVVSDPIKTDVVQVQVANGESSTISEQPNINQSDYQNK